MKLYIGRKSYAAATIMEAQAIYVSVREAESRKGPGFGGSSTFPPGVLHGTGSKYRISYNGRVWDGVDREVTSADTRWLSLRA